MKNSGRSRMAFGSGALLAGVLIAACGGGNSAKSGFDGGAAGLAGDDDGNGAGFTGGSDGDGPGNGDLGGIGGDDDGGAAVVNGTTCASAKVVVTRAVPEVWLMVDGSGSMSAPLQGGASRYGALRDALIAQTTGLVFQLQSAVAFGLFLYDGCAYDPSIIGPGCVAGACPRSVVVPPALDNFAKIQAAYPSAPPGTSTPTDVALQSLAKRLTPVSSSAGSAAVKTYVVLATDGEPNLCDFHDGIPSNDTFKAQALGAVQSMAASGTKLFAISLSGGDAATEAYLKQIASAGGTGTPPFTPTSKDDLVKALENILGAAVSCDVRLNGKVARGKECGGAVRLDGKALPCNGADGWKLTDASTLSLVGAACDALRKDARATLSASFPCDAVTIN